MDPIQLQRLVDGELSFDETQDLLQAAERHPEMWRTIAGTFIENQVWQREFSAVPELLADASGSSQKVDAKRTDSIVGDSVRWFALAASLLLAVSVGFLVSGPGSSGSRNQMGVDAPLLGDAGVNEVPVDFQPGDIEMGDLNQQPVAYRMQVRDPKGNQFVDSDVPLYPVNSSEFERYIDNSAFTNNVRREAARSGYDLQHNVRYLSGQMKDGRRFVIPVRKYNFYQGQ